MVLEKIPFGKLPGIRKLQNLASKYYENRLLRRVENRGRLPEHIGIILDGNRRFAEDKGVPKDHGHLLGAEKLEDVLGWAQELGIRHVTVYAFSKENFQRPPEEVEALMELLNSKFEQIISDDGIHENQVRVRAIGDLSSLPESLRDTIKEAEEATENYENISLNIAVGYGGRSELTKAVGRIVEKVEEGELEREDVDKDLIEKNLYTSDLPDPDLIIRTSGEERLSGFLLWQSAYSELYFCEANWPNFDKINFLRAVYNYQGRERRHGK